MREIILKVANVFRDPARVYQGEGAYSEEAPCCVGAHLANFFNVAEGYSLDYAHGAEMLGQELRANRTHVILMLRSCGAPHDPFGAVAWATPPAEVFRKLALVEETPDTNGADFFGISFEKAHMGCAQLHNCNLKFTDFSDAVLESANLSGADMEAARFLSADMYDADLSKGYLAHAAFQSANLEKAKFKGAYVEAADFQHATLDGADFAGANPLDCADFADCDTSAAVNFSIPTGEEE